MFKTGKEMSAMIIHKILHRLCRSMIIRDLLKDIMAPRIPYLKVNSMAVNFILVDKIYKFNQ